MGETVVQNKESDINNALTFVKETLAQHGFSADFAAFMAISTDEILSNIIHYAYTDDNIHDIIIRTKADGDNFTLIFEDDGIPFNPTVYVTETQADIPLVHRKKGGLGIYLVSQIMDDMNYVRESGKNILTLVKSEKKVTP